MRGGLVNPPAHNFYIVHNYQQGILCNVLLFVTMFLVGAVSSPHLLHATGHALFPTVCGGLRPPHPPASMSGYSGRLDNHSSATAQGATLRPDPQSSPQGGDRARKTPLGFSPYRDGAPPHTPYRRDPQRNRDFPQPVTHRHAGNHSAPAIGGKSGTANESKSP